MLFQVTFFENTKLTISEFPNRLETHGETVKKKVKSKKNVASLLITIEIPTYRKNVF